MDCARAWEILRDAEVICAETDVQRALHRLAGEIAARLSERYPLVLSVMGGSVVFSGQLLPLLRFPLEFDYLHATRYDGATRGGHLIWKVLPRQPVAGRTILVLDDILDEGDTLAAIKAKVLERGASSCKVAVLTDKVKPGAKPIVPDFVGLRIPDKFVFGCGLDAYGSWRNLPAIYALKQP
jgi:hypoxanthine phosphoribosyltransferase